MSKVSPRPQDLDDESLQRAAGIAVAGTGRPFWIVHL